MATSLAKTEQIILWEEDIQILNQMLTRMIEENKNPWNEYTTIINLVESLRKHLESLVNLRQDFTDPAVLSASQALDEALNEFYRICLLYKPDKDNDE